MFKTELHCHSKDASPCGKESVEKLVEIYTKAGYDTVVLSNHFAQCVYDYYGCKSMDEYVDLFMNAGEKMIRAAEGKLTVLIGAELRFNDCQNDYLLFGDFYDFIRNTPDLFNLTPQAFHEICKQKGWLFVQAHPFRLGMTVINPEFLDGMEVYNGHIGHPSRNFIAEQWAEAYGLIKTSGTDLHYDYVPATGGIATQEKIQSMAQLVEILKSGNYTLLKSDKVI